LTLEKNQHVTQCRWHTT